jgi:hypothetical protein
MEFDKVYNLSKLDKDFNKQHDLYRDYAKKIANELDVYFFGQAVKNRRKKGKVYVKHYLFSNIFPYIKVYKKEISRLVEFINKYNINTFEELKYKIRELHRKGEL